MIANQYKIMNHDEIPRDDEQLNVDFYLDLTGGEEALVYGHPDEGFLFIANRDKKGWAVRHIYVLPHRRGEGISRALLDAARNLCLEEKREFFLYLTYNDDYTRQFLHRYVQEHQLQPCVPTRLFIFENREFYHSPEWIKATRRMQLLTERWEAKGAITTTFDKCPEVVLENLKNLYKEEDEKKYQVSGDIWPFISDRYDPLSFITYMGDEPMTFVFTQRFGDSILFSGNLALKKYHHNGCFILPIYRLIKGVEEDLSINRLTCKIVGYNHEAVQLAENIWSLARPRYVHMQVFAHFMNEEETDENNETKEKEEN